MIGGMIRMIKLADFLRRRSCQVTVLAASGPNHGYCGYEDLVKQLNVVYVANPVKAAPGVQPRGNANQSRVTESNLRLRAKAVVRDLIVPDIAVFSVLRFYRAAVTAIQSHGIRHVLISSPPHSMQLVGWLLKRRLGDAITVISDYRDSWNCQVMFAKRNPVSHALNLRCERATLKSADYLLYVSDPILKKINRQFFDVSTKAIRVMNGFDPAMQFREVPKYERRDVLTIAHFGSINAYQRSYRDPQALFAAIVKSRLPINVALYGPVDCPEIWQQTMGAALELHGNLPHDAAVTAMMQSDVLLFLHTVSAGSDEIVSGKLFDYILARRPILVVGPGEMEVVRIVAEARLGYCLDVGDPDGMQAGLEKLYDDWANDRLPELAARDISGFSRDLQYEQVLKLLA